MISSVQNTQNGQGGLVQSYFNNRYPERKEEELLLGKNSKSKDSEESAKTQGAEQNATAQDTFEEMLQAQCNPQHGGGKQSEREKRQQSPHQSKI